MERKNQVPRWKAGRFAALSSRTLGVTLEENRVDADLSENGASGQEDQGYEPPPRKESDRLPEQHKLAQPSLRQSSSRSTPQNDSDVVNLEENDVELSALPLSARALARKSGATSNFQEPLPRIPTIRVDTDSKRASVAGLESVAGSTIKEEEGMESSDDTSSVSSTKREQLIRRMDTVVVPPHISFWARLQSGFNGTRSKSDIPDYFYDYSERRREILRLKIPHSKSEGEAGSRMKDSTNDTSGSVSLAEERHIPTLRECVRRLHNEEAIAHDVRASKPLQRTGDTCLNIGAAFYIYITNTIGLETFFVILNAVLVTLYFLKNHEQFKTKLDFSFLAFAVVFPLSFLIQQTFARRDLALMRLADFRACVLSTALFTFSTDWPAGDSASGGRLSLPHSFNRHIMEDCENLLQMVYEYLSMPAVSHARHVVFKHKQIETKRVRSLQNDIIKRMNDAMFDFYQHTEEMKRHGFPSGEASRLHQYHQYLQQRFEGLRYLKYYRTPQSTRSFGRVYIIILPWLAGPYYAWVYDTTNLAFTLVLAGFTFLILLGLLNTQQGMEDPFLPDITSFTPGVDTVKLEYEMASTLQAIEQYYANAELLRVAKETVNKGKLSNTRSLPAEL